MTLKKPVLNIGMLLGTPRKKNESPAAGYARRKEKNKNWNLGRSYFSHSKEIQHYLEYRLFDLVQMPSASVIFDKIVLLSGSII